jgi:hypothetical protein
MFGAMDFGIADHRQRAGREQAAQVAVSLFADTTQLILTPARALLGHEHYEILTVINDKYLYLCRFGSLSVQED